MEIDHDGSGYRMSRGHIRAVKPTIVASECKANSSLDG